MISLAALREKHEADCHYKPTTVEFDACEERIDQLSGMQPLSDAQFLEEIELLSIVSNFDSFSGDGEIEEPDGDGYLSYESAKATG